MSIRAITASLALAVTASAAAAQGTSAEALQIAQAQNACGSGASIQSAEFLPNGNVRVVCQRAAGGDLGGTLGATGTAVAGLTFVAIIAALGDGGSSSSTNGT